MAAIPKYKCRRPFWFNGRLYKIGEEVEYPGFPSENLEPLDAAGRQKAVAYAAHQKAEAAKSAASKAGVDPGSLEKLIEAAVKATLAAQQTGGKPAA